MPILLKTDFLTYLASHFSLESALLGCAGTALVCLLGFLIYRQAVQKRSLFLNLRLDRLQDERQWQQDDILRLQQECSALARECREIDVENAGLQSACAAMRQQINEREIILAEARTQIEEHFQAAAAQIMAAQGETLTRQHQSSLNLLLKPLHEQLGAFRQRLDDVHHQESRDRISLQKELEQLRQLNKQLSNDAINLTEALRGNNKTQGLWGEIILAHVLEASGLRQGEEFDLQVRLTKENGDTYQPDAIVHLPEDRHIIIDAKVSLKDFTDANYATNEDERAIFTAKHLASVKRQITLLAGKQYHLLLDGPGTLDFVLLFIPVEQAFQLVMEKDVGLLFSAIQQRVILTSPSTLLATLRTIHHLWRVDEQHRNSLAIAKQAASIYDKLVGFVEAFDAIELRLNQTQQAWHTAKNRLSTGQGNVIARAEALKALGIQPNKNLPVAWRKSLSPEGE